MNIRNRRLCIHWASSGSQTDAAVGFGSPSVNPWGYTQMNWHRIEGKWQQFKGMVRKQWGKLTDDPLEISGGKRDQLVGRMRELYGLSKDEAEKRVRDLENRYRGWMPETRTATMIKIIFLRV